MHGYFFGFKAPCGLRFSAEFCIVRAKNTPVAARARYADAVIFTIHRYKIADRYYLIARFVDPSEGNDALAVIVIRYPAEAVPRIIYFPKLRRFKVEFIKLRHIILHIFMCFIIEQQPVETFFVVPLYKLRKFLSHK